MSLSAAEKVISLFFLNGVISAGLGWYAGYYYHEFEMTVVPFPYIFCIVMYVLSMTAWALMLAVAIRFRLASEFIDWLNADLRKNNEDRRSKLAFIQYVFKKE